MVDNCPPVDQDGDCWNCPYGKEGLCNYPWVGDVEVPLDE